MSKLNGRISKLEAAIQPDLPDLNEASQVVNFARLYASARCWLDTDGNCPHSDDVDGGYPDGGIKHPYEVLDLEAAREAIRDCLRFGLEPTLGGLTRMLHAQGRT